MKEAQDDRGKEEALIGAVHAAADNGVRRRTISTQKYEAARRGTREHAIPLLCLLCILWT
jgi:hypothetical protein